MRMMFSGANNDVSSFNQPLNKWNVSKVTNIAWMFAGASSFNQPLNKWNVSKVTNVAGMFKNTESFNQPLNNWNVSNRDVRGRCDDAKQDGLQDDH